MGDFEAERKLCFSTHTNQTLTCEPNKPRLFEGSDGNNELKAFFTAFHSQWKQ